MPKILDFIKPNEPLLNALNEFLGKIDATLPPRQDIKFYLSGGMLVFLYTGLQRSYYIEGEFNRKVHIQDGLTVVYQDERKQDRLIRFNKNDNCRFNLMHNDYLDDAIAVPFPHLKNMQVYALAAVDVCVSKIGRLSPIDIDDIQTLVKFGFCTAEEIEQRANEALSDYLGDLSHFRENLVLAVHYAKTAWALLPPNWPIFSDSIFRLSATVSKA